MDTVIAIDCGSTNLKAGVFDRALRRLSECSVPVEYSVREKDRVEFEPEAIRASTMDLLRMAVSEADIEWSSVTRVSLASQAQTFTVLDEEGRPLMPFVSWLDKRADREASWLAERFGADFHAHCSFGAPLDQLQLAKMLWVARHLPEVLEQGVEVTSLPGFLIRALGAPGTIDRNLAAMNGLYSLRQGTWWTEAIEACGLSVEQMPALVDVGRGTAVETPAADAPVASGVAVICAGNDQTAGAFDNGCREGEMLVTLGTALVAYRFVGPQPGPYHPDGCWGPYPGGGYYELATHDAGCASLDWAREELLPGKDAPAFDRLASSAEPGCGGVEFHPLRARTGSGWRGKGTPEQKARAVLEGIGYSLRGLIEDGLSAAENGCLPKIRVIGGGSKSDIWLQILADVLNTTVVRGRGDTVGGAARMAWTLDPAQPSDEDDARIPDPQAAVRCDACYRTWREHE